MPRDQARRSGSRGPGPHLPVSLSSACSSPATTPLELKLTPESPRALSPENNNYDCNNNPNS